MINLKRILILAGVVVFVIFVGYSPVILGVLGEAFGDKNITYTYAYNNEIHELSLVLSNDTYARVKFEDGNIYAGKDLDGYLNHVSSRYDKDMVPIMKYFENRPVGEAIAFVQQMPYDTQREREILAGNETELKFPYETLYDGNGVCSDKSLLLIYIMKRLGYRTAYLKYTDEMHAAVGIGCPCDIAQYGTTTGECYCYIDAISPAIPTDNKGNYTIKGKLVSDPEIYVTSGGHIADLHREYLDANRWNEIISIAEQNNNMLPQETYNEAVGLANKYGINVGQ